MDCSSEEIKEYLLEHCKYKKFSGDTSVPHYKCRRIEHEYRYTFKHSNTVLIKSLGIICSVKISRPTCKGFLNVGSLCITDLTWEELQSINELKMLPLSTITFERLKVLIHSIKWGDE